MSSFFNSVAKDASSLASCILGVRCDYVDGDGVLIAENIYISVHTTHMQLHQTLEYTESSIVVSILKSDVPIPQVDHVMIELDDDGVRTTVSFEIAGIVMDTGTRTQCQTRASNQWI